MPDERTIAVIRSRHTAGESIESLAIDYGMTDRQISNIIEPQWAIEVRSTNAEFFADMDRATLATGWVQVRFPQIALKYRQTSESRMVGG
jgi:hypothetical protein